MTDDFDPTRWGGPVPPSTPPPAPPRPPRPDRRRTEPFLKGPIPWAWVTAAAALPGKALAVGLGVWFKAGCERQRTVSVTLARLRRMGMSASTARRGLKALERAGLVSTARRPGRAARVTLVAADDPPCGTPPTP